jgi:hypothetical protein
MAGVFVGLLSGPATLTMDCTCGFETGAHHRGPSLAARVVPLWGRATAPLSPRVSDRSAKPRHMRRGTELLWSVGFRAKWDCPARDFSVRLGPPARRAGRRCRVKPATAPPRPALPDTRRESEEPPNPHTRQNRHEISHGRYRSSPQRSCREWPRHEAQAVGRDPRQRLSHYQRVHLVGPLVGVDRLEVVHVPDHRSSSRRHSDSRRRRCLSPSRSAACRQLRDSR